MHGAHRTLTHKPTRSRTATEEPRAPTRDDPLRARPPAKEVSCFLGNEDEDFDDLPDENEGVPSILAEMEALKAVFDAAFQGGPSDRALACVKQALSLRSSTPATFESQLTTFCLSHLVGQTRSDLFPRVPSGRRWARRTFEALALGWVAWVTDGSKDLLQVVHKMHQDEPVEDDEAVETLSLNFFSKALEMLVMGRPEEAKKFFERANQVGAQFGTSTNPSICWVYATSFFPKRP